MTRHQSFAPSTGAFIVVPEENEKSEPFSNRKQVRIFLVWWARVDSNSCGAVAEDSVKTAQWAVFSSAARAIHPRPPKNRNVSKYAAVLFYDTFSCCFCFALPSEQLCKNTVLHNKPGGGQGENAAIKGGVPGADTVLHKGQLRGGKLLAVQSFVGIKIEPLAQTRL